MKNLSNEGKEQLRSMIVNALQDRGEGINTSDLHHEIFNTDYFIIGYYEAEQWLINNYGIFNAMATIQDYENDNFGEVNTDLSSSEKVVNMLTYILGEELLNECDLISNNWDKEITPKLNKKLIKHFS